ncbi:DUF4436 family protein [Nonomuraea sp. NPDC050556]|uniref:DUF4436 family protein n=1 Tax=Nonomuraea sp. NPDC050556 TaxID=3364369 RepID=UPI0037A4FF4E
MRRIISRVAVLAAALLVTAAGVGLYLNERGTRESAYVTGADREPDRVDLDATIKKVNADSRELILHVVAEAKGALADREIAVDTSSFVHGTMRIPAGDRVAAADLLVDLEGMVTDYPFDRYTTRIGFAADVPLSLTLWDGDAFFHATMARADNRYGTTAAELDLARSRGTRLFAWLMMVVMWALALGVIGASFVIVRQSRGLVWPAMGWMAASLFALAGFRSAAPGAPPIGSILDYAAFFWVELIIAGCLAAVVVYGVWVEHPPEE